MKSAMKPTPEEISEFSDSALQIEWSDGHSSVYAYEDLRLICPCATCRRLRATSRTGKLPFKTRIVPGSGDTRIKAEKIDKVGLYALQFKWNDGHDTGIYTFEFLRENCPCERCEK
ncbi:gamma-butyrobetaine hydroxylase-like domain-containing protein [Candidatus Mycalebacterium sp.]